MWCALNCQAYGTPPYYPLFVVFLPEASSLASIGPLYSAFLWVLQYPSSILSPHPSVLLLPASLRQMRRRGANIPLCAKQESHGSRRSEPAFLVVLGGGAGGEVRRSRCPTTI